MPLKLEIRARAQRDILAITRFIAEGNGDYTTAERWAQRLLDRCEEIVEASGMGAPYKQRPGVRKLNEGVYKIFYQSTDSKVVVLRVWDGRRGHDPFP